MKKKVKITIESEGHDTQVIEAYGIAGVTITDGQDDKHHGISVMLVGNLSPKDLVHLKAGVEDELVDLINQNIKSSTPSLKEMLQGMLELLGEEE